MIDAHLRHENKWINNALSPAEAPWTVALVGVLGFTPNYLVCYEQTEYMNERLRKLVLDDDWTFSLEEKPGHYWGKATSKNPKDPTITYDPLKGTLSID